MIFIMARSFKEAIQHRRTHYGIGNNSPISDNEIHEIIKTAVTHVPSAFNSQSTRIVLLLGESHKKLLTRFVKSSPPKPIRLPR